ncbi:MAG: secondary thiamine-phosphate synthase enzyme YjbQ [Nitrososphaerota archaeon]|nr:secondary thiamine-phosphate synthase enzyme YjbQ [Candidatus Geocrenenecus dongiae]
MKVYSGEIDLKTRGEGDIIDLSNQIVEHVKKSGVRNGLVSVFAVGSTVALTTMEYESGLKKDLIDALERIAPRDSEYQHHLRWGDYNGHSHVRASIVGPSLTIPLINGEVILGTWQQVVLLELDIRPRSRKVIVTVMGD